jgi:FMN phosphatase YigB (HAD superfamily)
MIEAVIFDVDGTLVDSNTFHVEAWQRAFRNFGKDISPAQIHRQIGKGADQLMPMFLKKNAGIEDLITGATTSDDAEKQNHIRTFSRRPWRFWPAFPLSQEPQIVHGIVHARQKTQPKMTSRGKLEIHART